MLCCNSVATCWSKGCTSIKSQYWWGQSLVFLVIRFLDQVKVIVVSILFGCSSGRMRRLLRTHHGFCARSTRFKPIKMHNQLPVLSIAISYPICNLKQLLCDSSRPCPWVGKFPGFASWDLGSEATPNLQAVCG